MSKEILQHIKASKQSLLNNAFLKLLTHPFFKDWYRKFGGGGFDEFCLYCYKELEQMEQSLPMMHGDLIKQPIDKQKYSPEIYSQLIEKRLMIARAMIKVSYEPPLDDKHSIIMHLHLMWHLYQQWSWPPCIEGMCLDLSFAKLLSAAHRQIVSDLHRAEQALPRNKNTLKTKQKKMAIWQSFVMGIYEHGEPIAHRTKLSEAISIIQEQFEKSMEGSKKQWEEEPKWGFIPKNIKKVPGRDSIIKWLREEGILERDFEKKGRYWFKRM